MSVFCTAYIIKMALSVVVTIYLILAAVGQVYLGANSYSQVLFGASLGITFAYSGHYCVKQWFYGLWDHSITAHQSYKMWWINIITYMLVPIILFIISVITVLN